MIWDILFRIAFIGFLVCIGCTILFAVLKNSIYTKMFIKIAAGLLAITIGAVILGRDSGSRPETPAASTQTTESQNTDVPETSIESYVQMLKDAIPFENVTIEVDDHTVYIGIWDDDITATAQYAAEGNTTAQESWKKVLTGFQEMTEGLHTGMAEAGYGQYSVAVLLLVDESQEDALAIIQDGVVVFDCAAEAQ